MTLFPLITVFVSALALCLLLTPIVRSAALRWGLVDEPDGRRKIHARPIPIAGGVAVLLTAVVVLAVTFSLGGPWREAVGDRWMTIVGLAAAACIIAVVGVADDYVGLRGRHKLFWQLVAVGIVIICGVEVRSIRLFGHNFDLGVMAIPFTVFWLLGAINSLNLIDGMDGLLSSVGCLICVAMAVMAVLTGSWPAACLAVALAGALLGFLVYYFPPATILLGASGSHLV